MWKQVAAGVIGAVIIGALTLIWNWASQGGLVRDLGGVTMAQLDERISEIELKPGPPGEDGEKGEDGKPGAGGELPSDIVVASTVECAQLGAAWSRYSDADGLFILGANSNRHAPEREEYKVHEGGGAPTHTLTVSEMPPHDHPGSTSGDTYLPSLRNTKEPFVAGAYSVDARPKVSLQETAGWYIDVKEQGGGAPHNNMPPYITLYWCIKS